jgi:hypothetical protein
MNNFPNGKKEQASARPFLEGILLLHLTGLLALGHHTNAQDAKRLVRLIYLRFHSHVVTVMPVQAVRIFDVPRLLIFVIHKNSFAVLALYPTRQPNGLSLRGSFSLLLFSLFNLLIGWRILSAGGVLCKKAERPEHRKTEQKGQNLFHQFSPSEIDTYGLSYVGCVYFAGQLLS